MLSFGEPPASNPIHWNYFLALEHDLEVAARYVEFALANRSTYSIEFAHILMAAASEVDVLAKLLCELVAPSAPRGNIDQYREVLLAHHPEFITSKVWIPRSIFEILPFDTWAPGSNPPWWRSYNNVKHERNAHFPEATLENAVTAMAALLLLVTTYYTYTLAPTGETRLDIRQTTSSLQPESTFLRLAPESYFHPIKLG